MTDDMRPCVRKALIDLHDTWAIDGEQGEHIAELLNDAYNAGANDTRQWRPLTEDPATWPEEGAFAVVVDQEQKWSGRNANSDAVLWCAVNSTQGWTHWLPLPAPPEPENP